MGIKRAVRHSMWIAWKDLLDFSRNRMGLVMLIVMPLFMMGMVGFIFPSNTNPTNVPVALANLDAGHGNSSLSAKFVTQLEAANNKSKMMDLSTVPSADDVKTAIQNGDESAGIVIGKNFTSDLMAGKQGGITVVIDQSNPQMSMLMQTALTQVIQQMGSQTAMHSLNQTYKTPLNYTLSQITPYKIGSTGIVPGQPNYFQFVAPGIMAMVMMMSLMTGLPHAISYEREVGTLDGMLVAPVHRISVIGGKVIAQTTRGMIQGVIILALAVILFGVVINGSVALVIGLMLLSVFSFVGLGILITSFMSTRRNGKYGHDELHVSYDVPQWRVLPLAADAGIYANYSTFPSTNVCSNRFATGGGAWSGRPVNCNRYCDIVWIWNHSIIGSTRYVREGGNHTVTVEAYEQDG